MGLRKHWSGIVLAALLVVPGLGHSQDPERANAEQQLRDALGGLSQAEADRDSQSQSASLLEAEVAALQAAVQSAADDLRRHEANIVRKTEGLAGLKQQKANNLAEWNARRTQIGSSLSALVRLAAVPPSATMMQEAGTTERLRSAFVLRALIPRLQQRADLLRQDLANIRKAADAVTAGQAALVKANEALERRLQEAERLATRKNAVLAARQDDLVRATATANRQAKSAQDIRELLARLDDGRKARTATIAAERQRRAAIAARAGTFLPAEPVAPLSLVGLEKRQGGLLLPATGKVERRFGEGNDAFTHGISITTARNAPVLAPADGRVRYAGEFQNYGLVLITDHGGGFHSVIAGLARVNAVTGQWVLAGEPMARVAPHGSLYVEIRKDGRPVDPLQWFTVGRS